MKESVDGDEAGHSEVMRKNEKPFIYTRIPNGLLVTARGKEVQLGHMPQGDSSNDLTTSGFDIPFRSQRPDIPSAQALAVYFTQVITKQQRWYLDAP